MKLKKQAFSLMSLAILILAATLSFGGCAKLDDLLNEMDLTGFDKLMIVAHPDDESLWAGAELLSEDYLVVCITKNNEEVRKNEYAAAMEFTGDKWIMFGRFEYGNWNIFTKPDLKSKLARIISYKSWDKIVTHNSEGEYGHELHIALSGLVTEIAEENNLTDRLWYFEKYYSATELLEVADTLPTLNDEMFDLKWKLIDIYSSQSYSVNKHGHMAKYEELIPY